MPVTYRIDKTQGIIRTKCSGPVTLEQVTEHFQALQNDPDCPPQLDVVLDLSESEAAPKAGQLQTVSHAIGEIAARVRFDVCAVVAPTDLLFGIGRMFEVIAGPHFRVTQVFRDATEAEVWLASQVKTAGLAPEPQAGE